MSGHVADRLTAWFRGELDDAAAQAVDSHVAECPACADALAEVAEVEAMLALALEPVVPSPTTRARVLATFDEGHLGDHAARVARMFGISVEAAHAALLRLPETTDWEVSNMPGVFQRLLDNPPPNCIMGFIRVPAGVYVPWHEHLGYEDTLVLAGVLRDSDGAVYLPGDAMPKTLGTTHTFCAEDGVDLYCAVILENGWNLL